MASTLNEINSTVYYSGKNRLDNDQFRDGREQNTSNLQRRDVFW
jgi:hypothetical protein